MESIDLLNLRAGECSFLEIALADVRRYFQTCVSQDKKQAVLVYPPLSARNRFLIHTVVQNHFNELNTVSIGSGYGRRTVVYHSSLKPMIRETKFEESNEIPDENERNIHRPYKTPNERKAQEKLLWSLMPKKKFDSNTRSTKRKQCKRPDIPIYVPKALRGLASNTVIDTNISINNSNVSFLDKFDVNSRMNQGSNETSCSKEIKCSLPQFYLNDHSIPKPTDPFTYFVDLSNDMVFDNVCTELSFDDTSCEILEPLSTSNSTDLVNINECSSNVSVSNECNSNVSASNECNSNSSEVNEKIKNKIHSLENDKTQFNNEEIECNSGVNVSKTSVFPHNISDIDDSICTQKFVLDIVDFNCKIAPDDQEEHLKNNVTMDSKVVNIKMNHEINVENVVVNSNQPIESLEAEHNSNCLHYCLEDSFSSEPLTDLEESNSKPSVGELIVQPCPEVVKKSLDIVENNEQVFEKKKKKKKIVLNVDECSWEDLYDKEDDYIHPLLLKELVSTMGKVQVKCATEDYRSHQTMEERSGDGECVIEVYGFSSDLKTIDLMNQFAAFRKKHFEIIWVDDTHALAVFESPYLADQALNTPFVLVKTRPLKNAIRESKIKAETVVPLPATRPKTCSSLARRLVSNALGLKVNVSPDLRNKERTVLENAKENKIRDAQLKHDVWNDEP